MSKNRCEYVVTDSFTGKQRKCKNNHKWTIQDLKYCTLHYNHIYKNNIIYIQKFIRGRRCRQRIKYYKNLNDDTQKIIIKYIRDECYNKMYNKSITNVIMKKIDTFITKYLIGHSSIMFLYGAIQWYNTHTLLRYPTFDKIGTELFHIYYLLDKYNILIKDNKRFYFYKYKDTIHYQRISMYYKLKYIADKIIEYSKEDKNLQGLSLIDNFINNLQSIKNFNKYYTLN